MTGQIEIRVTSPVLRTQPGLELALERAADVIYGAFPQGGPCVAGDLAEGALTLLFHADADTPEAWLPQLHVLCAVVHGPIQSVNVGPWVEAAAVAELKSPRPC